MPALEERHEGFSIPVPHVAGLDLGPCFRGQWRPVHRSLIYRVSLVAVALLMLLIPLIYLAMISGIAYGTYWYATHMGSYFFHTAKDVGSGLHSARSQGRASLLIVTFGYIAPIVLGGFVLISMLKSLLAPSGEERESYTLERHEEPVVYAFIEAMCVRMGAPVPHRIDVFADANATAGMEGGLLGFLFRRRMVLGIGMPLVAGMNLPQFAGVMAHEFGHFCQGGGMLATLIVNSIRNWLIRLVFHRDAWDFWLLEAAAETGNAALVLFAVVCTWISFIARLLFFPLLLLGELLYMILSRQMEYDADLHQARFSGSAAFEQMCRRLVDLVSAYESVSLDIRSYLRKKEVPDDLPALVAMTAATVSSDVRERNARSRRKTGLFDTHPSEASRIARAQAAAEPGIFASDQPARVLFRDFYGACKKATYATLKAELGRAFYGVTMVPVAGVAKEHEAHAERMSLASRFLGYEPPDWRPVFPNASELQGFDDPKKGVAMIKAGRSRVAELSAEATAAAARFRSADREELAARGAIGFLDLNIGPLPKSVDLEARTRPAIGLSQVRAQETMRQASPILDEAAEHASLRLIGGLRLLHTKGAERYVPDAEKLRKRSSHLYRTLVALRSVLPTMASAREDLAIAEIFAGVNIKTHERFIEIKKKLNPIAERLRGRIEDIRRDTGSVQYPFENPSGQINLAQRLVDQTVGMGDLDAIASAASSALTRYPAENRRVLAELIEIALIVERAFSKPATPKSGSEASAES